MKTWGFLVVLLLAPLVGVLLCIRLVVDAGLEGLGSAMVWLNGAKPATQRAGK